MKQLLTTEEAAKLWGVSKKSIYSMVRKGRLKPFIGLRSWRFKEGDWEGVLKRM